MTPRDLLQLPPYTAYVRLLIDGMSSSPFSIRTLPPAASPPDSHRSAKVRSYSRQRYARPLPAVEREIREALVGK